jgi:hypothetical protein
MREWFVRNAVALVVIVVAVPALVGVLLGLPLYENAQTERAPIEVAAGDSVEVAGYTWTLAASGEFPHAADNAEVPEGLAVTAAVIQVRPGDDPLTEGSCDASLTSMTGGRERHWQILSNPYDFNYEMLDESTSTCLLDGEPFDLEVVYLTPDGTISEATLDVEVGVVDGELIRFAFTD